MSIPSHEKLRLIRESELLSQREFSDLTGVPYGSYSQYEQGRSKPGLEALRKIFKHQKFRKYRDWFLFDEENLREGQDVPVLAETWLREHSDKTA
ncbi:helix-turn-helix transcriptional regulator [Salmonella enterica]|nr:helix-turn-helix transcriptional regulator [Salmonella enterica]EJJ4043149.1 helix-turn-helix transcriptional regulator [Salmonella enterica]EJJ4454315.1 helix-turn-helix transcriptional regulator [Salmonella enterica]EJJ4550249.1 helix-turn-helix transcriptional regulator [Salmonella enterica]EJJ4587802.1 helix-turn-helix transcriptional regulator [Salmonella enterica]